ncbi:MAG: hypothetical protein IIA27_13770 [Gemmatimonadetes bacterium]|nr:hypothetical protein [Gemmatimonadota bacterium]
MQSLIQDLRYAVRAFTRSPGFTAVVVFSIAIGIAVNTTMFSVINAVLFRGLPVERPHELVNVYATQRGVGSFLLSAQLVHHRLKQSAAIRFFSVIRVASPCRRP